jgi:5-methylcytosine-specific restriction endonuclease McrA
MANPNPSPATRFGVGQSANPGGKTSSQKKMELAAATARADLMAKLLCAASEVEAHESLEEIMADAKTAIASFGVPVDKSLARLAVDHFGGMAELQNWASRIFAGALADIGVDVAKARIRQNIDSATRYKVLERAGFKCQACGAKPSKCGDVTLHIDHIVPVSLGGTNAMKNLQALCAECNISKGNRSVYDHNDGWS